jgi:hypothetical protein
MKIYEELSMLKVIDSMSFVFNCFCAKADEGQSKAMNESEFMNSIVNSGSQHNIHVLPIQNDFELDNLYPTENHVDKWSTFIVGKDKTYILANSAHLKICDLLVNHKGNGILPNTIEKFLDPIWDRTLDGNQVQLFMIYDSKTYLLNSYFFKNNTDEIIGACMFMRLVDSLPNTIFKKMSALHNPVPKNFRDRNNDKEIANRNRISFEGFKTKL